LAINATPETHCWIWALSRLASKNSHQSSHLFVAGNPPRKESLSTLANVQDVPVTTAISSSLSHYCPRKEKPFSLTTVRVLPEIFQESTSSRPFAGNPSRKESLSSWADVQDKSAKK
jgi:hypothetical protein